MPTLKQIEAVYWVHTLGGFAAAAARLNTTQSTISKRVSELERHFGTEIFDRQGRAGTLTLKGREVIDDFAALLRMRDRVASRLGGDEVYAGNLRLGVTEMVALTWLPRLVSAIRGAFPRIVLEPRIDIAGTMLPQLARHKLDLVIAPNAGDNTAFSLLELDSLDFIWVASPALLDGDENTSLAARLARLPLLTYAEGSLLYRRMRRDLAALAVSPVKPVTCNSMIALAEMARAGLGATYIPRDYFAPFLKSGDLVAIPVDRSGPLPYAAFHLGDPIGARIAELARHACDFGAACLHPPMPQAGT